MAIDIIYTTRPTDPAAFVAADLGLMNGCISTDKRVLQKERYEWAFKIEFIDNEFKNYNHQEHLEVVKEIRPKYATVRDIMTKEQCEYDRIEYYEFGQIMDWAWELNEYTENVIIIPKYDCLKDIPKDFMLGFSVLTKYGGTSLPIECFSDWKVHLLGGNPKKQIELINQNDNVVSFDNNYIEFIAQRGRYITPMLVEKNIGQKIFFLKKPRIACLNLSFNALLARFEQQERTNKKSYIPKGQLVMF